eukprot:1160654-Pelagomonas_calceolata.AAC.4
MRQPLTGQVALPQGFCAWVALYARKAHTLRMGFFLSKGLAKFGSLSSTVHLPLGMQFITARFSYRINKGSHQLKRITARLKRTEEIVDHFRKERKRRTT